ncbi:hypothetical protein J3Q64DRAFT_1643835 [Phycomyces blakesleeanus]|uniref:Tudor domain-containing protein n=2 Tax=Phycomyces blakesleeanus TaxID=4837 RepID=A0A162ZUR9_PHYB8|nr:hypothetical protein PHYBLDRAFT_159861 [Phycomyces blakesleeanus NRRL 1555(-)]OAD69151.1 hypothetical protein PHYBLDRAFT_159861 [Phycomyces blakesleeanus NRRL 1555(-)]|eukprot:XP_018287191.1 hypothetical protein PHYBLDRAFT_159861 [Phycomyces blakesleeanus NRRL 1555(-)]
MNAEEAESYQYQLDQVDLALSKDPDNEELKKLHHDLKELIALTTQFESAQQQQQQQQAQQQQTQQTSTKRSNASSTNPILSTPISTALKSNQFTVGQEVMAKYAGDGEFYRATITAIGGADQVFSVVFRGYQDNELVKAEDIKALDNKKRQGIFEEAPKQPLAAPPKKKKKEKTPGVKKVNETEVKKNAWLNFASGSDKKKKKVAAPINKKSIFKTPDNPEGRVGVVGSGRGMTTFQQRGKHVYADGQNNVGAGEEEN